MTREQTARAEFSHYDDWPTFDTLAALDGFTDSSWHNDVCPSLVSESLMVRVWCDFADPEARELGPGARFSVHGIEAADDYCPTDDGETFDTLAELVAYLATLEADAAPDMDADEARAYGPAGAPPSLRDQYR